MSDTTVLALIAAIAPTLAAVGAMIQNVRNHKQNKKQAIVANVKADTNQATTEEVKNLVAANVTDVATARDELSDANRRIGDLHSEVAKSVAQMQQDLKVANQRIVGLQALIKQGKDTP